MNSIGRSIYRIKSEAMAEFDLKSSHVTCIYFLHRGFARTASDLCEVCEEDKANISRALKELEERGLITRELTAKGRPKRNITLTKEGHAIGDFLSKRVANILEIVGEGVDEGERDIMYRILSLIDKRLEHVCNEYC